MLIKLEFNLFPLKELIYMGKPKKRTSHRRTGTRRSHLVRKLAETVNARSPVRVYTGSKRSSQPETTPEK